MLLFAPQPLYYSRARDLYHQPLAADSAHQQYLSGFDSGLHSYRRPRFPSYANVQEALAHEYHRQQEAARREELARHVALERHRQQQLERHRRQQRYLVELERRQYLDAIRRAQRESAWPLETYDSEDDYEEPEDYNVDKTISPPSPVPAPSKAPIPEPSLEQKHSAATAIQSAYRAYLARCHTLNTLSAIRATLATLTSSFVFPAKPSFDTNSLSHDLSYNSTNAPIHVYEDALMRLLSKLDSVESNGDAILRKERKRIARDIEAELERLDQRKEEAWEMQRVEMELQTRPVSSEVATDPELEQPQVLSEMETIGDVCIDTGDAMTQDDSSSEVAMTEAMDQHPVNPTSDFPMEATFPLNSTADLPSDGDSDTEVPSLASLFEDHNAFSQEPELMLAASTKEDFILVDQEIPQPGEDVGPRVDNFVMV